MLILQQMELIEHRQKKLEQDPLPLTSVLLETSDTQSKAKISSLEFRKVVCEGVYDESKSILVLVQGVSLELQRTGIMW